MTDFAVPNAKPGPCAKCQGTGTFRFAGRTVNGKYEGKSGMCYSCRGTGHQSYVQIKRNECYNRHKPIYI